METTTYKDLQDECRVVSVVSMVPTNSDNGDLEVSVHIINTDLARNQREVYEVVSEAIKAHMLG